MTPRKREEDGAERPAVVPLPEPDPIVGRSSSEIQGACKELAFETAQYIRSLVKDAKITRSDTIKLAEIAAKHALGQKVVIEISNPEVLELVGEAAARHMTEEAYRAFREELEARFDEFKIL